MNPFVVRATSPDRRKTFFVHYEIAWKTHRTEFWAGGKDISALFRTRTEAYQSQSQFITNLDFPTFFGEGELSKGYKLLFNCYPPHRVQSNPVIL